MRFKTNFLGALLFLFVVGAFSIAFAEYEKIVVAAEAADRQAAISEVAGRANYFLFFNGEGSFLEAVKNPFLSLRGGAGPKVAEFLVKNGAVHVVAGKFGYKMEQALSSFNVVHTQQTGISSDAVQALLKTQ